MAAPALNRQERKEAVPLVGGGTQASPPKSKRAREIAGVVSLLAALYLLVSLFSYDRWDPSLFTFSRGPVKNYGGIVGAYLADVVFSLVGVSGYLVPVFLIFFGIRKIVGKERNTVHTVGFLLLLPSVSLLFHLVAQSVSAAADPPGGAVGFFLANLLGTFLAPVGSYIVSVAFILVALILVSPVSLFDSLSAMKRGREKRQAKPAADLPEEQAEQEEQEEPDILIHRSVHEELKIGQAPSPAKVVKEKTVGDPPAEGGYRMPPLEFLKESEGVSGPAKEELNSAAAGLEKKLADFGVSGKIKQAYPGPVVTMYEFEPAAGVKINRIVSLSDDLALALRAPSIRVYPIAGKAALGIEVPNRQRATVYLKEIFSSD
ncbi:MAG: DNA translocase FtsK 4TM domain-containing protein, partial [Thermodesulfovibrionales bacterium]